MNIKSPCECKKWISVQDRLPPNMHEVMYFAIDDMNKEIMIGHRQDNEWTHCCMFYGTNILNDSVVVTHWMELPEFPKDVNPT